MRVATGVEMLEIPANLMTGPGFVNPTLIWDENEAVLVDAGFPRQVPQFRDAFEKAGVLFKRLSRIIITHSDTDHVGGLAGILLASPQKITVLSHEKEKPYIEATLPPLRLAQMEAQVKQLPEGQRQQMAQLCESLKANYQKLGVSVDRTVEDNQELPYCGGLVIIYTPGHTPGHICIYHKLSRTLIAGDMLAVENLVLTRSPQYNCLDLPQYKASLQKLTNYDVETVICYHGGAYKDNVNERLRSLANDQ